MSDFSDEILQLRARISGNLYWMNLIEQLPITDTRLKRIICLLKSITDFDKLVLFSSQEILKICSEDPVKYRGYNFRLARLKEKVAKGVDYVLEFSKRALLWLELIRITGSRLREDVRITIQTTIREQQELVRALARSAFRSVGTSVSRPPGPASLPYGQPEGAPCVEDIPFRPLRDGKPVAPLQINPYTNKLVRLHSRWDPDCKMPGSQYVKFLRFPGPFFAPRHKPDDAVDYFEIPETAVRIMEYYMRMSAQITRNFINTGRLHDREPEAKAKLRVQQKISGMFLASTSGEDYDLFSIKERRALAVDVEMITRPYVFGPEREVNFGDGTGNFKFEDINRILKIEKEGDKFSVEEFDSAIRISV